MIYQRILVFYSQKLIKQQNIKKQIFKGHYYRFINISTVYINNIFNKELK